MNDTNSSTADINSSDLAAKLRLERNRRAWTQETLAEKAGIGLRTIQRIECGEAPSPETLRLISAAFGIDPADLGGASRRTLFKCPYLTKQRAAMLTLALAITLAYIALLIAMPVMLSPGVAWGLGIFYSLFLADIVLGFVTGLGIGGGKLHIHHWGWASKRDLAKLTGISHCPEINARSRWAFWSAGTSPAFTTHRPSASSVATRPASRSASSWSSAIAGSSSRPTTRTSSSPP
jgi:transcriptional regulator with XRE-family HTH domain